MHIQSGVGIIADERQRVLVEERFDPSRDARYTTEELSRAAMVYVCPPNMRNEYQFMMIDSACSIWPWPSAWYKPGDGGVEGRIRELAKAGQLIAAEIDRLLRG